jgi:hypothetical protein
VLLRAEMGPVVLSYELEGELVRRANAWAFEVTGMRMGHLPMPGPLGQWLAIRVLNVFSMLDQERALLNDMERIRVGPGILDVKTAGRA